MNRLDEKHAALLARLGQQQEPGSRTDLSPGLVTLAEKAGVLHLLADQAGARDSLGEAHTRFLSAAAMGALRLRELAEISKALAAAGIQVAPLKGMAYSLLFEQGGPLRPMADIDLLVEPDGYERALAVIRSLGYHDEFHSAGAHARVRLSAARAAGADLPQGVVAR